MGNRLWYGIIMAGVLLTRLGFNALGATAAPSELTVMALLTAGLCACLLGVTGLLGMLDWMARAGQE